MMRSDPTKLINSKPSTGFTIYLIILIFAIFHISSFIDVKNYCNKLARTVDKYPVVKVDAFGSICWLYKDGVLTSVDQELQLLKERK